MSPSELAVGVLMLAGVALFVLAGVGLHRFEGVFARMHAATKPATLGLVLVVLAASVRVGDTGGVMKLLLVVAFQFVTAPIAAHLVGRAAHRVGVALGPTAEVDELTRDVDRERETPDGSGA